MNDIWQWNAAQYGEKHADTYRAFLKREMKKLTRDPHKGASTASHPSIRHLLIRRRSKRHGHGVFYEIADGVVYILFIYHSAPDWHQELYKRLH